MHIQIVLYWERKIQYFYSEKNNSHFINDKWHQVKAIYGAQMLYVLLKLIFDKAAFHRIKWKPNQSTFIQSGSFHFINNFIASWNINDFVMDFFQECYLNRLFMPLVQRSIAVQQRNYMGCVWFCSFEQYNCILLCHQFRRFEKTILRFIENNVLHGLFKIQWEKCNLPIWWNVLIFVCERLIWLLKDRLLLAIYKHRWKMQQNPINGSNIIIFVVAMISKIHVR